MKKRHLDIPDTRAAYARLSLLPRAAEFGLELDPADTAPFTVRWNAAQRRPEILFRETLVAYLEDYWDREPDVMRTVMCVRTEFPADKDFALLRAVANAVALTDQIGRMEREEKARKKKGYVTMNGTNFLAAVPGGMTTLIGARAEERDFTFSPHSQTPGLYHASLRHGKGSIAFTIEERPGEGLYVQKEGYVSIGPKAEEMTDLLHRGAARWARSFDPAGFRDVLSQACALPEVDRASVMMAFQYGDAPQDRFAPVRIGAEGTGLVLSKNQDFDLFHNGLWVGQCYFNYWGGNEGFEFRTPRATPWVEAASAELIDAATQKMGILMILNGLGRTAADYPVLDTAALQAAVEETDFGYGF